MRITNPSKISDFRDNLLLMLLFWVLVLFDSYAYWYKNRGCRMCNSPFFVHCSVYATCAPVVRASETASMRATMVQ